MDPEEEQPGFATKEEYKLFYKGIYRYLQPKFDSQEFNRTFEEDWQADDADGSGTMDKQEFFNAMFELVDNWYAL